MHVLPDLEMIKKGKVKINGIIMPVFDIEVLPGEYSDPSKLRFEWKTTEMTSKYVQFRLEFEDAIYVSSQE